MFYTIVTKKLENGKVEGACPDLPGYSFESDTEEEALEFGKEFIPGVMELYYRRKRRQIPLPSSTEGTPYYMPARVQAKILLWNYMAENRYRVSDLAKKLGVSQTMAQRYVDLSKDRASIDAIEDALKAFGLGFTLSLGKNPT